MNLIDYGKEANTLKGITSVENDMEGWVIGINHCLLDIAHSLAIQTRLKVMQEINAQRDKVDAEIAYNEGDFKALLPESGPR